MKIRTAVLALGLFTPFSHSFADEPISVSSAPFQSVDYWGGSDSRIIFYSVRIREKFWQVSVPVNEVAVALNKDKYIYTTINLVNGRQEYPSDDSWLKAEKVEVVVRQKGDFIVWQKFLSKVKKRQELERKKGLKPIRVLPSDY